MLPTTVLGSPSAVASNVSRASGAFITDHATEAGEQLDLFCVGNVDQRFIGEDYAVASADSIAAIRELAQAEGVFAGPVYTGKGFGGMLDHVRSGWIAPGSNVAVIHTGDTGNLLETPEVVGNVAGQP